MHNILHKLSSITRKSLIDDRLLASYTRYNQTKTQTNVQIYGHKVLTSAKRELIIVLARRQYDKFKR